MPRFLRLLHNLLQLPLTLLPLLVDAGHFLRLCLHLSSALAAGNLFLRKQLALYQERNMQPRRATNTTRLVMVWLGRWFDWRQALAVVQPGTFLRWHRQAYRLFWRWKSRLGRPPIPADFDAFAPMPGSRARRDHTPVKTRTEQVDLAEAVRQHDRVVILGDPGAGKTMLMRFLTLQFALAWRAGKTMVSDKDDNAYGAVRLPILMRVAHYADVFMKNRGLRLKDFLHVPFGNVLSASEAAIKDLVHSALKEGQLHERRRFTFRTLPAPGGGAARLEGGQTAAGRGRKGGKFFPSHFGPIAAKPDKTV